MFDFQVGDGIGMTNCDDVAASGVLKAITVKQLTIRLKRQLQKYREGSLWVEGEIRNLNCSQKGHTYFDLVEPSENSNSAQPDAVIAAVLFRYERQIVEKKLEQFGNMSLDNGMKVCVLGQLDFYYVQGRLQLLVRDIDPKFTLGDMEAKRRFLMEKLSSEGLLRKNCMLDFPIFPMNVGLVASKGSAGYKDFMKVLDASGLGWNVKLANTLVQGVEAPEQIASAVDLVGRSGVDVIAVIRGGGSSTNLAAFDDEKVVRAVANAPVPVVTGVGHEIDRTVVDEVAHTVESTPTAAAMRISEAATDQVNEANLVWNGVLEESLRRLDEADKHIKMTGQVVARSVNDHLRNAGNTVESRANRIGTMAGHNLRAEAKMVNDCKTKLENCAHRKLYRADKELSHLAEQIRLLDPKTILGRGWSITRCDGLVVHDPTVLVGGDLLVTTLAEGELYSTVNGD